MTEGKNNRASSATLTWSLPFSSGLSSLLHFYPTILSTLCVLFLSFHFSNKLLFFHFLQLSVCSSVPLSTSSFLTFLCKISQLCVCQFAVSVVESARPPQFLRSFLWEITVLQSAAVLSQIKGFKLELADRI